MWRERLRKRKIKRRIKRAVTAVLLLGCALGATVGVSKTYSQDVTPSVEIVETEEIIAVEEIKAETEPEPETKTINDYDLELLAHLINGEAGSDWCSDEMLYYVGSVVLNRVNSDYFPDTIEGVIFQRGQYSCTWDGNFDKVPVERAYRIAEELLTNGSVLPKDVIYQAEFKQGSGVYKKVQNMYFCYQ